LDFGVSFGGLPNQTMNDGLKVISIPPALKRKTMRSGYYRQFVFKIIAELQETMKREIAESAGSDVVQKREWMLEGANRVVKIVRRIKYKGRHWQL
jgi:hypothetical protein